VTPILVIVEALRSHSFHIEENVRVLAQENPFQEKGFFMLGGR